MFKGKDPQQDLSEIREAYQEFETGISQVRADLRALIERTIGRIDAEKANEILKSITP